MLLTNVLRIFLLINCKGSKVDSASESQISSGKTYSGTVLDACTVCLTLRQRSTTEKIGTDTDLKRVFSGDKIKRSKQAINSNADS